jgi:hypothetical protein
MMLRSSIDEPPDTRKATGAPEWPFLAFVIGLFILIALRSLLG